MNIQVNAYSVEQRFMVQPHVSIDRIFEHVASDLGLSNRQYFGLQSYNDLHHGVVWMKPSDSLSSAIKKGLRCMPMTIHFYLRAHAFPTDFEEVRKDTAALMLFYSQVAERFNYRGYRASSELELALAALVLLIERGPLDDLKHKLSPAELIRVATSLLALPDNQAELTIRIGNSVLQLWSLFGAMHPTECMFNYLTILASAGYSYEKVRFTLTNYTEKKPSDFEVSFNGIEIRQPGIDGHSVYRSWPWTEIHKIDHRGKWLTVRLHDRGLGSIVFQANCKFAALRVSSLIKTYHSVHMSLLNGTQIAPVARLILSKPEQFVSGMLRRLVALDLFTKPEPQHILGKGIMEEVEQEESQEQVENKSVELVSIVDELTAWVEANQEHIANDANIQSTISQLVSLSNSIYEQMKSAEVNNSANEFFQIAQTKTAEQVKSSMESQASNCDLIDASNELTHQIQVPVEIHCEKFAESGPFEDAEETNLHNSSESGDDLVPTNDPAKSPETMTLQSQSDVMCQKDHCLNDLIFEAEQDGSVEPKSPEVNQGRNRFGELRLDI